VTLVAVGVALLLLAAAGALGLERWPRGSDVVFRVTTAAGCLAIGWAALNCLSARTGDAWSFEPTLPGGAWRLEVDVLSAWFLLVLAFVGGAASLYGATYLRPERGHRSVAAAHAGWALLLAAMVGVLVARSAVPFLVTWEVMAVSAYLLIVFEDDRSEARLAGLVYLISTHVGTLALLAMFVAWGHAAGGYTFAALAATPSLVPAATAGILALALIGFGMKAGVFPFHFWLPGAHAAAPSHVSALLSGVMLKVGIYGLLRVVTLLGPPPAWWGWTLLSLGAASAVLGVLWALGQSDLKRALAYSSVENIGIVVLGMGVGSLGTTYHRPTMALLGYAAALLHVLNHALFKSLLFLGAGSVVRATGSREIDRLGGLARHMPRTAAAFFIGAVAIIGLPPLNGFVSEWTLMRAFLGAGGIAGALRWTCLGAAALALVGALALACFVRLAGAIFLGSPRDPSIPTPRDSGAGLAVPMAILAAACATIGLLPAVALGFASRVAAAISGPADGAPPLAAAIRPLIGLPFFPLTVMASIVAAWSLRRLFASSRRRAGPTWGCAFPEPTARMQYTSASFGAPLLAAFPMAAGGSARSTRRRGAGPGDRVLRGVARPLWNRLQALALAVRPLQQGRVTTYLQYMIWTVLVLLASLLFVSSGAPR
jgi:formate hydrogenlyase subunit 3/multisubunit Na+/H+ antiporter MnhD subunit